MEITYKMLQLPPWLFFILMISFGGIISGLSTFLFRKYVYFKIQKSHNEVTGFLFFAVASFYSLLLSFIMFLVWNQLFETRGNVTKEGSYAVGLYRDIKFYPDTAEAKQLMIAYLGFVSNVIYEEFPDRSRMQQSVRTSKSLNKVYYKLEHLNPDNQFQIQLVGQMFNHLNGLDMYRGLRITSMGTEISPPFWLPMILGGIITMICAMLMDIENKRIHIILNALLGVFIMMLFFSIILLDHPFTGKLKIKPESYMSIFALEKQPVNLHPRENK